MTEKALVALVLISHSEKLAEGLKEIAAQMAPSVRIEPAGGRDDGGIGTSFDKVTAATEAALEASKGRGVLMLTDLGSANMVAETVIEFSDSPDSLVLADGPFVEAAVVAAVASEQGDSLDQIAEALAANFGMMVAVPGPPDEEAPADSEPADDAVTALAEVVNEAGLHARPAATFVRIASVFDADITIDGVDAKTLMQVISLGKRQGDEVVLRATGPQAKEAIGNLVEALETGFGE